MKKMNETQMKQIKGGNPGLKACLDECSWWNAVCTVGCHIVFDTSFSTK